MRYLLAHDLGTSGNKATLFSEEGNVIRSETASYGAHYFLENHVEQNADDWWNAVCASTKRLISESGISAKDIAAVSFSGQMMGCLPVGRDGKPLRPSIIWADSRAAEQTKQLESKISQYDFYHITGHRNTASYGIQKLMWIRDNEPEIYEQTYKTLNAKDYIVLKLTGNFYTDPSDGNSCDCFDLKTLDWSEEILSAAGIDPDKLPEIIPSTAIAGYVTKEAAELTGMAEGTPVIMGGGDGVMANVGCGSISPGKTYCCMGTSAWITTTAEKPIFDEQMRTVTWAHVVPGMYAPNGTMQYAGGSYSWLKNTVARAEILEAERSGGSPYDYMNLEIEESVPGSNGVIFLPYLLGERAPRWDPDARGAWLGLKPENTRGDLMRSVLEGVSYNLALCLDILKTQVPIDEITVVGGGAKGKVWRQILADVFGTRIMVPEVLEEAGAMGAAVTAGVGAGVFKDFTAIDRFMKITDVTEPNKENRAAYHEARARFENYYAALKGNFR